MGPDAQPNVDAVAGLAQRSGREWKHIDRCKAAAASRRMEIASALEDRRLIPTDCSFIVHGSLARGELTIGSDIDWTLLVDGAADPQHLRVVQEIAASLGELDGKPPGRTAVFGTLTFSHDLLHLIGGDADTNRNMTRRMLLLLESSEVQSAAGVRERVLRNILRRYLEEDHGYHALHDYEIRVPRFLLNDIVRFWRTMAVDYAAKRRERAGVGWAIRNVKLRISRKLIFVAGLAMCLSCELRPAAALQNVRDEEAFNAILQDVMLDLANKTPLENIAAFAALFGADAVAADIVSSYDRFLGLIEDADSRKHLESMDIDQAVHDATFKEAREIGNEFQDALTRLFFSTDDTLTRATQRYGVF